MDGAPVTLERRAGVAYLTLSRPAAMNAIDESMLAALADAVREIGSDPDARVAVITGAGDTFCVGLDIGLLGRAFDDTGYFRDVLERYRDVLLSIEALPVPVVAAVNGLARAGGFELMLACDMAVVADEARVADHHLAFGIVPGGGSTQRLPRRVGWPRAAEILFTGRWLVGHQIVAAGLALRCVPRAYLADSVEDLVGKIRPLSRPCLAATKRAMREGISLPIEEAVNVELERFVQYLDEVPSAREGYRAYVEKREPRWG